MTMFLFKIWKFIWLYSSIKCGMLQCLKGTDELIILWLDIMGYSRPQNNDNYLYNLCKVKFCKYYVIVSCVPLNDFVGTEDSQRWTS